MFTLQSTHMSGVRAGMLTTAHGTLRTPFFMPIATKGAVKTLSAADLESIQRGIDDSTDPIVLSNTYHLYLRPGLDILRDFGGLHEFMRWPGSILTDSGGFQIFSLADLRTITDDGVEFRSHIDGSLHMLTPERSMEIQSVIGSDIWMAFDYFPGYPASRTETENSVHLTTAWAKRCKEWYTANADTQAHQLFGIVQGGVEADLREQSARELVALDMNGYAVGGLAVGEPAEEMYRVLDMTTPHLPADKPRYLMGVGMPEQILEAVKRGVDMFDCVLPTRNARHGSLFVHEPDSPRLVDDGLTRVAYTRLNIKAERFSRDKSVIDPHCSCQTCASGLSRAYVRHLFSVNEPLAARLMTIHNISLYLTLMKEIRDIISYDHIPTTT